MGLPNSGVPLERRHLPTRRLPEVRFLGPAAHRPPMSSRSFSLICHSSDKYRARAAGAAISSGVGTLNAAEAFRRAR